MFQLYDQTRRRISLTLFVLLAIAPTAGVIGYALWLHTSAHLRSEEERLGQRLGFRVSLKSVRHLTPARSVLEGVELADYETGRTVLSCARVECLLQSATDARGNPQPSLVIAASDGVLDWVSSAEVWIALDRFLSRRTGGGDADVAVSLPQLVLQSEGRPQTVRDVQVRFRSDPAESSADLSFRLAQADASGPVRFCVGRSRKSQPPLTGFVFDTGTNAVPGTLLPASFNVPGLLGPECLLQGCIQARRIDQGWSGWAKGQLWKVDLDRLVSGRFPHTLRGSSQMEIGLEFSEGRVRDLSGKLYAVGGKISGSLLEAAVLRLGLEKTTGPDPISPNALIPFDELTLAFQIDEQGLRIGGKTATGQILGGPSGPLLTLAATCQQPMPVASLLQALVPVGHVQLPTSPQAEWLMERLPCSRAPIEIAHRPPSPDPSQESPDSVRR